MLIAAADVLADVAFPGCFGGAIGGPAFLGTVATGGLAVGIAAVAGILFPSSIPNAVSVKSVNNQFHLFVSGISQLILLQRLII